LKEKRIVFVCWFVYIAARAIFQLSGGKLFFEVKRQKYQSFKIWIFWP
jgi:hypothetical protein